MIGEAREYIMPLGRSSFRLLLVYGTQKMIATIEGHQGPRKVNVGCGPKPLPGWVGMDIEYKPRVRFDARDGLPLKDESVDRIYSEHFLEHFDQKIGVKILKEFHRALKPGGRVRIAMPDLREHVINYLDDDWQNMEWVKNEPKPFRTGAEMLNAAMRWWGHEFLYDYETLEMSMKDAGFVEVVSRRRLFSRDTDLLMLETRVESTLIAEAAK